ncbi:MAG: hypothetical protein ACRD4B_00735, partial [Acidobacteriota bacterium]
MTGSKGLIFSKLLRRTPLVSIGLVVFAILAGYLIYTAAWMYVNQAPTTTVMSNQSDEDSVDEEQKPESAV